MHSRPMISSSVTVGLLKAIKAGGGDADEILPELDINQAVFSRPDAFLPCAAFARLLERAAAETRDFTFGLHFGAHTNPKNIGALAYAVINSPTVADAFATAGRYLHLHNQAAEVTFREDEDDMSYLNFSLKNLALGELRQFVEYGMAIALNILRVMVGSQWSPREVHFTHAAPPNTSEHVRFFRAPVIFDCAANSFVVEREFCKQPVPAADPHLFKIVHRYLETVLSHVPKEDQTLTMIRRKIAEAIKDGAPNLGQVARAMSWSPRTLQRQLNSCGIDFRSLVDDTRRRFALDYLKDSKNSLTQIAFLLGYSEVSAFNRSFKRWTGKTPLDYRRRLGELAA